MAREFKFNNRARAMNLIHFKILENAYALKILDLNSELPSRQAIGVERDTMKQLLSSNLWFDN